MKTKNTKGLAADPENLRITVQPPKSGKPSTFACDAKFWQCFTLLARSEGISAERVFQQRLNALLEAACDDAEKSALEKSLTALCVYQGSDSRDHQIFRHRDGRFFIERWGGGSESGVYRPIGETEAIRDWVRCVAPCEFEKVLLALLRKRE